MARYFAVPSPIGPAYIKPNKLLMWAAAASFVVIAGLRANIGDTYYYMHAYATGDFSWASIVQQKDIGFGILQMILKMVSNDPQLMVFVTALITNVLIVLILYKYSRMFELSLYVYITSGMFVTAMNGIRQYLAAAVIFAATRYLLEGNWKRYMLVVLVAATIHQSALVLIPIYFIVRRKAWTGVTFCLLAVGILFVIGFNQFTAVLFSALQDTQYGQYKDFSEQGANVIRVAVDAIPLIIAYFGREKLRALFPQSDIIVNMSIVSIVLMTIATQNWIFARMTIYFGLYQLILFGWIIKVFRPKDQKFIYFAVLVFYFIFHYYDMVVTLGLIYKSNYLIL
jgi:transmembrane protein EpsG